MKDNVKVLCFLDSLGSGGAQRQLTELAKLLRADGYQVKVICWIYYENDHFLEDELAQNGVIVEHVFSFAKPLQRFLRLRSVISKNKPDVVISYYYGISIMLCVDHIINNKYKLIVSERNISQNNTSIVRLKYTLYRFASFVVPNSISEARFIQKNYSSLMSKVIPITNFVDDTKFFASEHTDDCYGDTKAIFVGRYHANKNIPSFLQALGIIKQKGHSLHVDFFGRNIEQNCAEIVRKYGIGDMVTFCGQTSTINEEYRKHNLFILPSVKEGYPNVLCEAMRSGLPVLVSDVSDVSNIIENGQNGFMFDPNDVENMADTIISYLILTPHQKRLMADQSSEISKHKFSKKRFIEQYEGLIDD